MRLAALTAVLAGLLLAGGRPAGAQEETDWAGRKRLASSYYKQGKWSESERVAVEVLERAPMSFNRVSTQLLLAEALVKQNKLPESLVPLEKVHGDAPGDSFVAWGARLRQAEILLMMGKKDESLDILLEVAAKCPFPLLASEATLAKGFVLLHQGKEADAQQVFQDLLRTQPQYRSDPQLGKALGYLLLKTGAAPQANEFISDSMAETDWGDVKHLFLQAMAYRALGKLQEANRYFQLVYKQSDEEHWKSEALYQMGEGFLQRKMLSLAKQSFQDVLDRFPRSGSRMKAMQRLALIDLMENNLAEAGAKAEKIAAQAAGKPEGDLIVAQANFLIGESALRGGQFQKAKVFFEKAAQSPNLSMESRLKTIWTDIQQGDYNRSVNLADDFLRDYPWGEQADYALLLRGLSYQKGGNTQKAAIDYVRFLDNYAQHPLKEKVVFLLASAYQRDSRWPELVSNVLVELKKLPPRPTEWQAGALFCVAEAYYELGRYSEALELYRDLIRRFPAGRLSPQIYQGLAFCQAKLEKYEEAFAAQKQALAYSQTYKNRDTIRYGLLTLGDLCFNKRRYQSAEAYYDAFLKNFPEDTLLPDVLYRSGFAASRLKRMTTALELWERVARQYPSSPYASQALLETARHYFRAGDFAKAEDSLTRIMKTSPQSDEAKAALMLLGQSLFNQGSYPEAIERFEEYKKLFPDDGQLFEVRKLLEMSWYQLAISKSDPQMFLTKYPDSAVAEDLFWDLGLKYWNAKSYTKSRDNFSKLLLHFPNGEKAKKGTYMLGEIYFKEENYKEAGAAYQNYLDGGAADPKLAPKAMFRLAVSLFQQGMAEEGAKIFKKFLTEHPKNELARDANYNLILTNVQAKHPADALEAGRAFVKAYPKDPETAFVNLQMGNAAKELGQLNVAAAAYRKVPAGSPQAIEAYYNLGQLHQSQEQYDKARAAYAMLVPLKPRNSELRLSGLAILAEFDERLGDTASSLRLYREVASLSKNPDWVAAAKQKIAALQNGKGGKQ